MQNNITKKSMEMKTKIYSIVYDKNQIVEYEKYDNSHIKTIEQRSYFFIKINKYTVE